MQKQPTDISKLHKKCVALFLKNQELIYRVELRNVSGTLNLEVGFNREKCPAKFPWVTFYSFQDKAISDVKLASIEKFLLTGIAEFENKQ